MIVLFLFLTLMLVISANRLDFAFAYVTRVTFADLFNRNITRLTDLFKTTTLHVWPALAAVAGKGGAAAVAGKGGAAAAGGKGGGMMSKMGGMMGQGGGGGGGGGGMTSLVNGATKPMKATMGLATGALQALQAMKLKRKADAAFPELVDPNQAAYLAELNQKRKSIETGADFAEGMRAADATNAATNDAITRNTSGDVGGTIQALLQSQRATGDAKNQVIGQGQAQQFDYDTAYGQKLGEISARKLQLQLARSSQLRAEWDRKSKLASANLQAGAAGLMPGGNNNPQPAMQLGQAPGANGAQGMDLSQLTSVIPQQQSPSMAGKPANPATSVVTTGAAAPTVVPEQTLATQGLGPVMNLLKK